MIMTRITPTPIPDLTTCNISASPDDNPEYANSFVISTSSASTGIAVAELKVAQAWFTPGFRSRH